MAKKKTIDDFADELKKCLDIARSKNHDYTVNHFLENFDDFGWKGIVVRIGDKYRRLVSFYHKGRQEISDESFEDTLRDMANYSILCLLKYQEEREEGAEKEKGTGYNS